MFFSLENLNKIWWIFCYFNIKILELNNTAYIALTTELVRFGTFRQWNKRLTFVRNF